MAFPAGLLLGLGGAIAAAIFMEKRARAAEASAAPYPGGQVLPSVSMAQLAPGAAAYLPPIMAPDWVRVTYANAMASGNPIQMAAAAQQLVAQYPQLAQSLSAQYQQLTNVPIPGVAGLRSLVGAPWGGYYGGSAGAAWGGPMGSAAGAAWGGPMGASAGLTSLVGLDPRVVMMLQALGRARQMRRAQLLAALQRQRLIHQS